MNIKAITRGALAIALICIFFTIFKGTTNIFNALLVPTALYISLINQRVKEIFATFGTLRGFDDAAILGLRERRVI